MTELNLRSPTIEIQRDRTTSNSRLWISLIGVLAFAAVGLDTGLFILVHSAQRAADARETELQRRLVSVEAKESQRNALGAEIAALEARLADTLRQTKDAEKLATSAAQILADRERAIQDRSKALADVAKARTEQEGLKAQVEALGAELTAARNASAAATAARTADLALIEKRRDALQATITDLQEQIANATRQQKTASEAAADAAKLKADRDAAYRDFQDKSAELANVRAQLEGLKVQRTAAAVDDSVTKLAIAARSEAETALAKVREQQGIAQQQLLLSREEFARLETRRLAVGIDEAAAQRAKAARDEAERALSKVQGELALAQKQLSEAQLDTVRFERLRQAAALDEGVAKRAENYRIEAEQALTKTQGDLATRQRQVADVEAALANAKNELGEVRRQVIDETTRRNNLREQNDRLNRPQP